MQKCRFLSSFSQNFPCILSDEKFLGWGSDESAAQPQKLFLEKVFPEKLPFLSFCSRR